MSDPQDLGGPITTDRAFSREDLAFINRMTTTGLVLPSVAHELNNALQIIGGMVEILGLRGQLPADAADKIQKVGVQATKAAGMLRELVAFARRDGPMRKVDLHTAVERALAFRRYYLAKGRVQTQVSDRGEKALVVRADSQAVVQVLVNLILNAEESMASQEKREIRIELWREGDLAHCAVTDSGAGFSPDAVPRAETAFFTTKPGGAAGLGLAVARQRVVQDGGTFAVEGPVPARIHVTWPLADA
jgi:C4-dicarboxylate-specific signal transduction histidine kinase